MQSQPIYPTLIQNWNQVDAQGNVITGELKNANGSINPGSIPKAEGTYISTETPSFQTFLYDVGLFSSSYSQQYTTIFNQTGALLLSLMTWCSATFFLLGFVAAWGISRRLPEC